ncbi:MAG: Holliday junction resolvase RuvX [Patescibacteria group bacterium]
MKFLGIDYGTKRIGFAVSDANGVLAFPKEVVKNNGELFPKIAEIIKTEEVSEIVVGESLDFAGLPNLLQKEIDFFVDKLKKKFALPVLLEKEFLTSVEARRYEDEGETDAKAAALILQRYLDKRNTKHDILIKA